jgi:hypothetical protein
LFSIYRNTSDAAAGPSTKKMAATPTRYNPVVCSVALTRLSKDIVVDEMNGLTKRSQNNRRLAERYDEYL